MKTKFTHEELRNAKGCYSLEDINILIEKHGKKIITIKSILNCDISIRDKTWFVYNSCDLTLDEKKKLSLLLSWAVLPIFETKYPNDNRVRECLNGIEKFIKGEITKEELIILRRVAVYAADDADAADATYVADAVYVVYAAYAYDAATYAYACAAYAADADAYDAKLTYTQKLNIILLEFVK